jgi:hypothetical protein
MIYCEIVETYYEFVMMDYKIVKTYYEFVETDCEFYETRLIASLHKHPG